MISFAFLSVFFHAACSHIPQQTVESKYDNLSLGVLGKADAVINRPGYALGYIEYHEQPAWVVYHFTKEEALTKTVKRTSRFVEDPEIPTGSATIAITGDVILLLIIEL